MKPRKHPFVAFKEKSENCKQSMPVPVRMNRELRGRLDAAAKDIGITRSQVVKLAVFDAMDKLERG